MSSSIKSIISNEIKGWHECFHDTKIYFKENPKDLYILIGGLAFSAVSLALLVYDIKNNGYSGNNSPGWYYPTGRP